MISPIRNCQCWILFKEIFTYTVDSCFLNQFKTMCWKLVLSLVLYPNRLNSAYLVLVEKHTINLITHLMVYYAFFYSILQWYVIEFWGLHHYLWVGRGWGLCTQLSVKQKKHCPPHTGRIVVDMWLETHCFPPIRHFTFLLNNLSQE